MLAPAMRRGVILCPGARATMMLNVLPRRGVFWRTVAAVRTADRDLALRSRCRPWRAARAPSRCGGSSCRARRSTADPNGDYTLTEQNGPWLIMAASFNGEGGEAEARALVLELRQRFNLPAFYYAMTFKIGDERIGRGIDDNGAPIRRQVQRGSEVLEHAVLVGEFPGDRRPRSPEPARADQDDRARRAAGRRDERHVAKPGGGAAVLQVGEAADVEQTAQAIPGPDGPRVHHAQSAVAEGVFHAGARSRSGQVERGARVLAAALPGKYTIKVATFRGRSTLQGANDFGTEAPRSRWAKDDDPLVLAGKNAHEMTVALRSRGWEAYEFHDRHESYVAVGSFDEMQELADGRLAPATREAQIIVNTFGASTPNVGFERPAYNELGVHDEKIRKVEHGRGRRCDQQYDQWMGGVTNGFHPKQFVGLPFDIQPAPIGRRSSRSARRTRGGEWPALRRHNRRQAVIDRRLSVVARMARFTKASWAPWPILIRW